MPDSGFDSAFQNLLGRLRVRRGLEAAAIAAGCSAIAALAGATPGGRFLVAAAALLVAYAALGLRPVYRHVSKADFAAHLDRRFPELEESARLVIADESSLTALQRLQRIRVEDALPSALSRRDEWLPRAAQAVTLTIFVVAGTISLFAAPIRSAVVSASTESSEAGESAGTEAIVSAEARVEPPAYTGLDTVTTDGLDLELPEGSMVTWNLRFQRPGDFAILIGDDQRVPLTQGQDDTHTAKARIDRTALYRVVEKLDGKEQMLTGVHTLSVSLDRPPQVLIVDPGESALEIEREQLPRFESRVVVRDDFGVGDVEIRASVAKGSGEGVKFRDEVFGFDTESEHDADDDGSRTFGRSWDLEALGMEPGDEVYFFVVAEDNRDPDPNLSRSDTVIVRWLDETPEVVTAGDVAIDFMPEYYKSQRQIIIETEALIADRDFLDNDTFHATSRALGDAQAELKNRYGQFLGDEFGESLDGDFGPSSGVESPGSEDSYGEHDDHDDHEGNEHGHAHADLPDATPPGSAEALIARFTHSHEVADIGPVSARNPVGLMKRAVASMWQSELHLRLSEPAKALPYQYDALDYYNRARQADRIFTRRLGFEPPPVSEDNRLTGDISDVQAADLDETGSGAETEGHLFRELYGQLSTRAPADPFSPEELDLLARAVDRLQQLAADRPALIRQAATLEQLRLAGTPAEASCEGCLDRAIRAAWSALSAAYAGPVPGRRPIDANDPMIREYAGLEPRVE